jgi:peptidoglycan/LPS O-acetylase OafA/YrhL
VATALSSSVRAWTGAKPYGLAVIAIAAASILCFLDQRPDSLAGRCLATRPLAYIGRISYGIYLWHYLIVVALVRDFDIRDSLPTVVLVTVLSIAVAAASYRFLESPFLLLQRYFRATVTRAEPPVETDVIRTTADGPLAG